MVHDYLASARGLKKLNRPKVGELPPRFGPDGLEIREPSELLNAGQLLAYTIKYERNEETAHLDWNLTATLTRIDKSGRALGKPIVRRTRLTRIVGFADREVGITVSGRPALYRFELKVRDASAARFLGNYGEYVRVVRRRSDPRLLLGKNPLRAGETTSIGVAEFGTGFLVFQPEYSVEAFDGVNWVPTAIQARTPDNLDIPVADSGAVAVCSKLPIPPGTAPGRYRLSQPVEHRWGIPRPAPAHLVLSAEFTVAP